MNSRQKGARGERQWRDELRANGYDARRGQQFCGSPDSPDVVCDALAWIHFEVKAVERLNIEEAMEQARRDARRQGSGIGGQASGSGGQQGKVPIVAHRRNRRDWLVTMPAEVFFEFLRGSLPPEPPMAESQSLLTSTATDLTKPRQEPRPPGVAAATPYPPSPEASARQARLLNGALGEIALPQPDPNNLEQHGAALQTNKQQQIRKAYLSYEDQ